MLTDTEYQKLQEQFVSNNNGTSVAETLVLLSLNPLSCLLRAAIYMWILLTPVTNSSLHYSISFLLDFSSLVIPFLFGTTLLSDYVGSVVVSTLSASVLSIIVSEVTSRRQKKLPVEFMTSWKQIKNIQMVGHRRFISHFRAFVLIGTAIAILAVDFQVFPRRFGKTESYGISLMDYGVGGFVVSNAIVSPQARGVLPLIYHRKYILWKSVRSCLPLVALGALRLVMISVTGYHEHVTEYGVHWNFFLTLAAVKIIAAVVFYFVSPTYSGVIALLLGHNYQFMLSVHHLRERIIPENASSDVRLTFFEQNREGIISCMGYLVLYFASIELGKILFQPRSRASHWLKALGQLLLLAAALFGAMSVLLIFTEPISRRLANVPYCLWVLFVSVLMLAAFLAIELVVSVSTFMGMIHVEVTGKGADKERKGNLQSWEPSLLSAVNQNGLFYFLLANLLTGLVNLTMKTLFATPLCSYVVLLTYCFVLHSLVMLLYINNVTVKFW